MKERWQHPSRLGSAACLWRLEFGSTSIRSPNEEERTLRQPSGNSYLATDDRGDYDSRTTEAILDEAAGVIREFGFAGRHVILIGGLVPGLLVPVLDPGIEPHVGSQDIDLCLSAALVAGDVGEYERVEKSLREAGFDMARKADGTRESWRWTGGRNHRVTIEFFCPASSDAPAGRLHRPGGLVGGKLCALALEAGNYSIRTTWNESSQREQAMVESRSV